MNRVLKALYLAGVQLLGCFVGMQIGALGWLLLHYLIGDAAYLTIVVMMLFAPFAIAYSLENSN